MGSRARCVVAPPPKVVVLREEHVGSLAGWLNDTLVIKVHGGSVRVGRVAIKADMDVRLLAEATISVEAHPYDRAASVRMEAMFWRVTWSAVSHGSDSPNRFGQLSGA